MQVDGESHFYSNCGYLGSTTTSTFNARSASQKFPADKVLSREQPASTDTWPQHCGCPGLAPWDEPCRPCWTELACPIPHRAPHTTPSKSRCLCMLWKNIAREHLKSCFCVQCCCLSAGHFSLSKPFPWSSGEEVQVLLFEEKSMGECRAPI